MAKKETTPFVYQNIYPRFRHFMSLGRKSYKALMDVKTVFDTRPTKSPVIPDAYRVCNTSTIDSDFDLKCLEGSYPDNIDGSLFIAQCLGTPEAFMVGDTNLIRMDFDQEHTHLTNRLMWTPAAMARLALDQSVHSFDYFGLMYLSPGLGMFSYTEGMYLMPDGRIGVTSDVDRPWMINRETLKVETPVGRRDEWIPMMSDEAGEVMGNLFAGYSNSHVVYTDFEQDEAFLVSYQYKQVDGSHPVKLSRWDGYHEFESYMVVDEHGDDIEIKQSIHELVFTRDYILLADTAFVAGTEMLTPWKNAPLPYEKTVVYIVDRRDMTKGVDTVIAKKIEVGEPCIHLIPEYENPNDEVTIYMLHTPATNTAEILKSYDKDLNGELFPEHLTGYGTLPVLDLSSLGKHKINVKTEVIIDSEYITDKKYTWGPYLYTYFGRQTKPFHKQDLFIMFKGFDKAMLPERIYHAYKDVNHRRIPVADMVGDEAESHNNSICRIDTESFEIVDAYIMPDKTMLYTITCLDAKEDNGTGYVMAAVITDDTASKDSSGHEYWIFNGNDLSSGPICKLGHSSLNNSTIFHTVYVPTRVGEAFDAKDTSYHIDLREDYPKEELTKWDPLVLDTFKQTIWPYFDKNESANKKRSESKADYLSTQRVKEHFGSEYIIEERFVDHPTEFAELMFDEVNRLFRTSGWKEEKKTLNLRVESKPISGPLAKSGVHMTRAIGTINASAKETFDMLVSPEGYAVIDPISKAEDHEIPPLEVYPWIEGARLEAAIATTNLPMMPPGEFVVLNAIDPNRMVFASKSILHEAAPGGSKYSNEEPPKSGRERALNTFAIKVEALGPKKCKISCVNYADVVGKSSAGMNNLINAKFFFPPLYKRISKAMINR